MVRKGLLGLVALALTLSAVPVAARYFNNPGSLCRALHGAEAMFVEYESSGVRSMAPGRQDLICPLTRTEPFGSGAMAFIDLEHRVQARTDCTFYSYSYTGMLMGAVSQSFEGVGFIELQPDLRDPMFSDSFSDYTVICTIPGNGDAIIYGVDLGELES